VIMPEFNVDSLPICPGRTRKESHRCIYHPSYDIVVSGLLLKLARETRALVDCSRANLVIGASGAGPPNVGRARASSY
jgi:hypothetical protein